ncbi:MAG: DUF4242 domain-containing protein [Ignavibacteriaceae bacterium]
MPIFMDRHNIPGVTAEHVAQAHQIDLRVQDKYNCKALTYWFDEKSGIAFCLIEAPQKESVVNMHNNAHGLIPNQIIEVEQNLVKLFLGRITDPNPSGKLNTVQNVINEPGFRTILNVELKNFPLLISKTGDGKISGLLNDFKEIINEALNKYEGRKIKNTLDEVIASFNPVLSSCKCAIRILDDLKNHNKNSEIKLTAAIGINTGAPVTDGNGFFGETVQLAKRLCEAAQGGEILLSSSIKDFYIQGELKNLQKEKSLKSLKPSEEKFLNRLMDLTESIWNHENFNINDFCKRIGLSKSQLNRNINSLTGYSPHKFIKDY